MAAQSLVLDAPRALYRRALAIRVFYERAARTHVTLRVRGASAEAFAEIAAFVRALPGVARATAVRVLRSIRVAFDPDATSAADILATIRRTPWAARAPAPPAADDSSRQQWIKAGLTTGVLAASLTGLVPVPLAVGAVALTAIPSFRRAWASLRARRANVDVLDATALVICLAQADAVTAGVMTTLLACGDIILDRTQDRARAALSRLMQLEAGEAFRLDETEHPVRVSPRDLAVGDRIVVYPGARIPADGVIVEGSLAVDEKAVAGESVPRERTVGDHVMAASVAVHGQAIVCVKRVGRDTLAGRIITILESAGKKPMTLQKSCERFADRFVLPTFGIAGAAWLLSGVAHRATAVIITDFGTGIRVAVPTAALTAMTLAARRGALVKGATYFERLAEADTVVFDKTGTLTLGVPEVTSVVATSASRRPRWRRSPRAPRATSRIPSRRRSVVTPSARALRAGCPSVAARATASAWA
jgi:Cu2+-exporting ATPase